MRRFGFVLLSVVSSTANAIPIDIGPYLQDVHTDGAAVVWETASPVDGEVIVGDKHFPSPAGTHHEVRVTGLAPGRYHYQVRAGDSVTDGGELRTAATGDSFTFLVYGDNRDHDAEHEKVVTAMAAEHADFLINTGDLTGDAGQDDLWRRFFKIEQPLLANAPMYPSLGNHELLHDPGASHFRRFFVLPGPTVQEDFPVGDGGVTNAPAQKTERWYAFRYANSLFVALDGNEPHSRAQAEWLLSVLDGAATDQTLRHVFVYFHQPPFSVGDFCGSAAEQGLWVPELERRGVRAVFTGHDHSYQRLERNGVRYFVTGGGGAPLHHQTAKCPEYDRQASKLFLATYHYLRVRIRGDQADLETVAVDGGQVIDAVHLHEAPPRHETPAPEVPYRDPPIRPDADPVKQRPVMTWLPYTGVAVLALILVLAGWLARRRRS